MIIGIKLYESIPLLSMLRLHDNIILAIYWMISKLKDTHAPYPHSIDPVATGGFRPNLECCLLIV